ncbi:MAG TPA: SDR family oxidoreductase [Verrucomicrobiae bacterium]|nr:SDR family oxidoreductase [Verrucomicrobiae bacterium]
MSDIKLKPLDRQVIVITGASSGIGLATAILAAERGATVVLAARSGEAWSRIVEEINANGGQSVFIPCDVARREQVETLARKAAEQFGRIDTWVNNAGVSIYGRLDEVSEEDSRQLFDTNFWGVYHGCLAALPYLKKHGGALINLGSEVSDAVIPYQGMYSASKHAVKGLVDALRAEIQELDHLPISITLIQPTATNTPYPQHARNYLPQEPKLPDPLDDPHDVAEAILEAAIKPTRSASVGAMAKAHVVVARILPKLGEKMAAKTAGKQHYSEDPRHPEGALSQPSELVDGTGSVYGSGGVKPKS